MLESCAFTGAKELEEIVLHEGIFSLGNEQTFASCTSLKQIILPSFQPTTILTVKIANISF